MVFGEVQLNTGLNGLNIDIEENSDIQTVIICCITIVATISVISEIKVGIRRLSEICFGIGCILLFTARFAGDSRSLQIFIQNLWDNCQSIIQLGFHIDGFAQLDIVPDEKEAFE